MASFTCPFCGCATSISDTSFKEYQIDFESSTWARPPHPYMKLDIYRCANEACKKETLVAIGCDGYIDNSKVLIYPEAIYKHFPEYVPLQIRQDYKEACLIKNKSPKAAATLARRCLQGMIRDFWDIKEKRLVDEINALQGKVPTAQWAAIDAVRKIGNIGAHMEKDVNLIIDVEPEEAESLLKLIELLIEKWYISRHDEEILYEEITGAAEEKARPAPEDPQHLR